MNMYQKKVKDSGQILMLAVMAVGLILVNTLLIIGGSNIFYQNSKYRVRSTQAVHLAEAGLDKAVASLNATAGAFNGEDETFFGAGSYSTAVTTKDLNSFTITSTGYIPDKTNAKVRRTIQAQVSKGTGISFVYGMLVGEGGLSLGNGAVINGSIYSNGNIGGGNNELITGDVYVAGGTEALADQDSDCVSPGCMDFIFGKNIAGNDILAVAQSFRPDVTASINKVSLKLKKAGNPSNPLVRILSDNNGSPDKNNILTSSTLSANLVTNSYGFVDVTFNSNPVLTAGSTYWIMIVASGLDGSSYWSWSQDSLQGYSGGSAFWSSDWQAGNPVWNSVTGDLGFKTWMGGVVTSVSMGNGSIIQGNVHAHTIDGLRINKDAYYQIITNSEVMGQSYPNSVSPPAIAMPISAANISRWQEDAESRGVINNDIIGCPGSIGPGKIIGNVTLSNSCTVTVTTPIWITGEGKGNLTFGNSTIFRLDSGFGSSSGIVIVDGQTVFLNGNNLLGSGSSGSYLTLLSTYDSRTSGRTAIETGNSSITGVLYAPFGIISLANRASFKEVVAWKINMGTRTVLTYDTGLVNIYFSAGPGGSFFVVKGTYQIK